MKGTKKSARESRPLCQLTELFIISIVGGDHSAVSLFQKTPEISRRPADAVQRMKK